MVTVGGSFRTAGSSARPSVSNAGFALRGSPPAPVETPTRIRSRTPVRRNPHDAPTAFDTRGSDTCKAKRSLHGLSGFRSPRFLPQTNVLPAKEARIIPGSVDRFRGLRMGFSFQVHSLRLPIESPWTAYPGGPKLSFWTKATANCLLTFASFPPIAVSPIRRSSVTSQLRHSDTPIPRYSHTAAPPLSPFRRPRRPGSSPNQLHEKAWITLREKYLMSWKP
jgi:hypothetical protein